MAELTTKRRNKLKKSTFGLPHERKYPMPDKSHAANAKARAAQQVKKGNLTAAEKKKIDAKANRILYGKSTGESKMKRQSRYDRMEERKGMEGYEKRKRRGRKHESEGMKMYERKKRKKKEGNYDKVDKYLGSM